MKSLIALIVLLPSLVFASATATLNAVDYNDFGATLSISVVDTTAGSWDEVYKISNAELIGYSTWSGFVAGWLSPKITASVTAHRTAANRVTFIQSKIGQQLSIP